MSTATVVDLSTPDHNSTRAAQQIPYDPKKTFYFSPLAPTPPSLVSRSELFRSVHTDTATNTTRTPQETEKKLQWKTTVKRTTASNKSTIEDKPKRSRKKITDQLQTALQDSEPASRESKHNTSNKDTKTRIKRTYFGENKRGGSLKNKTLTGRVSKAGNAQAQQLDAKSTETPLSKPPQKETEKEFDNWEAVGLNLEGATKRRQDWTPTKDNAKQAVELDSDEENGRAGQEAGPAQDFSNLLSGYGFTGSASSQSNTNQAREDGNGPTKRRRIELMDSRIASWPKVNDNDKTTTGEDDPQPTGKKPKRQPKKATTLTARVTARYASDYIEDSGNDIGDALGGSAPDVANKRRKAKAKKPQEPEYIVLSPETAVKSLDDQDLMFGTCSQLEREDSPTVLRDMQMAINASESYMEPASNPSDKGALSSATSHFKPPRNLWAEAFRDLDGEVAQAEVLDLVEVRDVLHIPSRSDAIRNESRDQRDESRTLVDQHSDNLSQDKAPQPKESPVLIEQSSLTDEGSIRKSSPALEPRPQMPQYNGLTDAELSKELAAYGFRPSGGRGRKARHNKIDLLQKCWEAKHGSNRASIEEDRQETSPLISVPKESRDMGGCKNATSSPKPKSNSRRTMDALEPKNDMPAGRKRRGSSRPPSSHSQSVAPGTARLPQPQQAPKLTLEQKLALAQVEEIEDSEDESIIPSPSRHQSRYFKNPQPESRRSRFRSPSLPISAAPSPSRGRNRPISSHTQSKLPPPPKTRATPTSNLQTDPTLPDLLVQITTAVHAQPRMSTAAGGLKHPSWHEKILMYDPIVLEDFATWLNTEGLGLVAEDREVSAGFVRGWCESKGICCCWKKERGSW